MFRCGHPQYPPSLGTRSLSGPFPREDRKRPTQQAQDTGTRVVSDVTKGLSEENRDEYHRWLLVHDILNLTYRETFILTI